MKTMFIIPVDLGCANAFPRVGADTNAIPGLLSGDSNGAGNLKES